MDKLEPLLGRLALHHRRDLLLDFDKLIKALQIKPLNHLSKNLITLLLRSTILDEHLDAPHDLYIIILLQLDLLHQRDQNVQLQHDIIRVRRARFLGSDELGKAEEELVAEGHGLGDRCKLLDRVECLRTVAICQLGGQVQLGQAFDVGEADALETESGLLDLIGDLISCAAVVDYLGEDFER